MPHSPILLLLAAAVLNVSSALRISRAPISASEVLVHEENNAHCGIVLGAFNEPEYVISQVRFASSIASLEMPAGWCPESPDLHTVPVVIYSDVPEASTIAARVPTGGKSNFRVVDMGTLSNPKPPFTAFAIKGGIESSKAHQPYWGWRPQMLRQSPFNRTITLDDDASPCSGQGMADLFGLLEKYNVDYTAPRWRKHGNGKTGKFNHGVMVMNRDAALPWINKWEEIQNDALASCKEFGGDQGSGNLAWDKVPQDQVRRTVCPESTCCAHYTPLPKCSQQTCLVHHAHAKGPYDEERIDNDRVQALSKISGGENDASPKPGSKCR